MGHWLRRIRGAVKMGFTWAAAWFVVGFVPRWVFGIPGDVPFPIIFGVLGFLSGVTFSGVVVLALGRRRFDEIALPRFAAWGAAGGVLLTAVFASTGTFSWGELLTLAPTLALASAGCAAGTLAVARRAHLQELPGPAGERLRDGSPEN